MVIISGTTKVIMIRAGKDDTLKPKIASVSGIPTKLIRNLARIAGHSPYKIKSARNPNIPVNILNLREYLSS